MGLKALAFRVTQSILVTSPFGQKAIAFREAQSIPARKRSPFDCRQLPILVEEDATSNSTVGRCQPPIVLEEVKELVREVKEVQSILTTW
jgi:hypothetical protein